MEDSADSSAMRILYLSPVHPLLTPGNPLPRWQTQMSHVSALEQLGHCIHVVAYTPQTHIRVSLAERLFYNSRILKFNKQVDTIFLSLGADVILPTTIRLLKRNLHSTLVILSGVSPISDGNPRERSLALLADLIVTNDLTHADEWRTLGAKKTIVLPISAIDPKLHYLRKVKRDVDVVFAGTVTPERNAFFQKLRKLLPSTVSFVVKHHVFEKDYAVLLSRAKIALNPLRPEMKHGANLRLFEIPAFGALQLASHTSPDWFVEGKEILIYQDAKDVASLVTYYLFHEKIREQIARRGQGRAVSEHTFQRRFEKLITVLHETKNS